jgi:hypothetical protein
LGRFPAPVKVLGRCWWPAEDLEAFERASVDKK